MKIISPKIIVILEQIGRYGCIVFMWVPLFVWKFGFDSAIGFELYIAEPLLNFAGRGDFAERCTHKIALSIFYINDVDIKPFF